MTKINVDDGKTKKIVVTEKKPVRKIAVEKPAEKKSAPAKKPATKKKIEVNKVEPKKIEVKKPVIKKKIEINTAEPKKVEVAKVEPKKVEIAKAEPKKVEKPAAKPVSSAATHATVQKSTTLSRRYVKKPARIATAPQSKTEVKPVRKASIFAARSTKSDRALKAAARAVKRAEKIERRIVPDDVEHRIKRKNRGRRIFFAIVCSAATVSALVAFVNINMPDISVRVAAIQTGIEATYPTFIPRNYSLVDVKSDKDGIVTMHFDGPEGASFTLSEEKSTWDSNALLNNYVKKYYPSDYTTLREQGITIYTRGENASWVNGGLLYKIESTGKYLTKEQIRNIATSL